MEISKNSKKIMKTHLTLVSRNKKTGPIPVSTSSQETCGNCPFKGNGCYAEQGPLLLHFQEVTRGNRGMEWPEFCEAIALLPQGQFWRMNQAGDLPGLGNLINVKQLRALVSANQGKKGFTYTHKYQSHANLSAIKESIENGFVINLSANNLAHADELSEKKSGPVVVVLPESQTSNTTTPAGRKVVICPATVRDNVSCDTCRLCQKGTRSCIVGFPAHGAAKRKASEVATG